LVEVIAVVVAVVVVRGSQ